MDKLLAQVIEPGQIGSGDGFGPIATGDPATNIAKVVSLIVGFITIIAALFFLFQILLGGMGYMTAAGDKNKLQSAQDRMTQSVLGLIIVVAAYALVGVVASVLGFDFLDLGAMFDAITI